MSSSDEMHSNPSSLIMSHAITRYNFDREVPYAFSHLRAALKFQYYCWSKNFEGCIIPSVDILIEEGCCCSKTSALQFNFPALYNRHFSTNVHQDNDTFVTHKSLSSISNH
jgi:hypothetical protein